MKSGIKSPLPEYPPAGALMMKLLLIRHGTARLQGDNRFWGKTDIELSDVGIRQAEQLRDRLARVKIDGIYTSTLLRASETAKIVAAPHKVRVTRLPELSECNFGFVEGLTFDEVKKRYPELVQVMLGFNIVERFPGGESFHELDIRVSKFLQKLKDRKRKETVAVVAHGGPLRIIICRLLGLDIRHWLQMRVDHASLSIVEMYPETAILTLLNDLSYLKS